MRKCYRHDCQRQIKPGTKHWFMLVNNSIVSLCSRECFKAERAAHTITPPAPKPEPRDPHQQEAFHD